MERRKTKSNTPGHLEVRNVDPGSFGLQLELFQGRCLLQACDLEQNVQQRPILEHSSNLGQNDRQHERNWIRFSPSHSLHGAASHDGWNSAWPRLTTIYLVIQRSENPGFDDVKRRSEAGEDLGKKKKIQPNDANPLKHRIQQTARRGALDA